MSASRLFQPIQLGRLTLQHRVVMPALTRNRVDKNTRVVGDDVAEHYALRAAVPGTLLITEATYITPKDAAIEAWKYTPGAWSPEQIAGWKKARRRSTIHLSLLADLPHSGCRCRPRAWLVYISPTVGDRARSEPCHPG